jgi:3-methyladenine DNA glycosylase Tag
MRMPTWHMQEHHVDKPTTDHDYFERMCRMMLMSGLSWRTLEKKWPGIRPDSDHS